MKRIRYELLRGSGDEKKFIEDYNNIFKKSLTTKEAAWVNWKSKHDSAGTITETVADLLVADFSSLVEVYKKFLALGVPETQKNKDGNDERSDALKELDKIFNYTNRYDDKIANFFINWADKLEIRSCYYCEMAYINIYGTGSKRRQFDLDHFLPKAKCPCVGLSLYNFVPSCQVCNSRIKLDDMPDVTCDEYVQISPSSAVASFDENITVRLRLSSEGNYLLDKRYMYIRASKPYQQYVNFFRLNDRYGFHKPEAERLKKLKDKYPKSNIKKIAKLLRYREKEVEEDIFNLNYLREKGRCFEKFTRDLLK